MFAHARHLHATLVTVGSADVACRPKPVGATARGGGEPGTPRGTELRQCKTDELMPVECWNVRSHHTRHTNAFGNTAVLCSRAGRCQHRVVMQFHRTFCLFSCSSPWWRLGWPDRLPLDPLSSGVRARGCVFKFDQSDSQVIKLNCIIRALSAISSPAARAQLHQHLPTRHQQLTWLCA